MPYAAVTIERSRHHSKSTPATLRPLGARALADTSYYAKKSKDSKQLPVGCVVAFFSVFLLAGAGFFAGALVGMVLPAWRASTQYAQTDCVVLEKKLESSESDGSTTYRPAFRIKYQVSGRDYDAWTYDAARIYSSGRQAKEAVLAQYETGKTYPCWYDPSDPRKSVLVRDFNPVTLLFPLGGLIFLGVGAIGIYFVLRSRSRSRGAAVDTFTGATAQYVAGQDDLVGDFPTLPALKPTTPGDQLAHRISLETSDKLKLIGLIVFTLFWNGITWLFVIFFLHDALAGHKLPRMIGLFLVPFVLIGIGALVLTIRQALVAFGIGPTTVEVSSAAVEPGTRCDAFLSQAGRMSVNALRVLLVCEESATYRQGTNTRTETRRVHEQELYRAEGFDIQDGAPHEARFSLQVPDDAMHSFASSHNKITWKLFVHGDIASWPDFERSFPIVVRPASGDEKDVS
jgi:hypothetical protein